MAIIHGYNVPPNSQGVVFSLNGNARRNRRQTFGQWEAEIRQDSRHVCVSSSAINLKEQLLAVIDAAHDVAQTFLDIVAVEERAAMLLVEPHNNIVWRTGPYGLKIQLTESITFTFDMVVTAQVANAQGQVLPDPPYMPPQHHFAYRYYRYSQAAENVVDCYRNMFLALECLLDHVAPKSIGERETDWVRRALTTAVTHRGVSLSAFAKANSNSPVDDFLDAHYSAIRCAVFHSKASAGHALRPGSLADQDRIFNQLLAVQAIVESLLKTEFSVTLAASGMTYSGFSGILEQVASRVGLLISVAECPTVEEIKAQTVDEASNSIAPVKFAGRRANLPDEWLLMSEIKPKDLPFSKIGCLRFLVGPTDDVLQTLIGAKLNTASLYTDMVVGDATKLVVLVRCILRNRQSPKTAFTY
jgi:hypothetical protein